MKIILDDEVQALLLLSSMPDSWLCHLATQPQMVN
uniref:Uncharacterized protein n=1 Tax=Arundo donax TaxID=35708 RepID=A0A0A9AG87_ARUDO